MAPRIEILGIYPVAADEPCHQVEFVVDDSDRQLDIRSITQEVADQSRDNWQVPWDEVDLDSGGGSVLAGDSPSTDMRIAFFFHYLDHNRPLVTPFGDVDLPGETPPDRLAFLDYEPP